MGQETNDFVQGKVIILEFVHDNVAEAVPTRFQSFFIRLQQLMRLEDHITVIHSIQILFHRLVETIDSSQITDLCQHLCVSFILRIGHGRRVQQFVPTPVEEREEALHHRFFRLQSKFRRFEWAQIVKRIQKHIDRFTLIQQARCWRNIAELFNGLVANAVEGSHCHLFGWLPNFRNHLLLQFSRRPFRVSNHENMEWIDTFFLDEMHYALHKSEGLSSACTGHDHERRRRVFYGLTLLEGWMVTHVKSYRHSPVEGMSIMNFQIDIQPVER